VVLYQSVTNDLTLMVVKTSLVSASSKKLVKSYAELAQIQLQQWNNGQLFYDCTAYSAYTWLAILAFTGPSV